MNSATRMLAMAGMALVAGAAIGASPASAMPAPTEAATGVQAAARKAQAPSRDRVVGHYHSLRSCETAGRIGERRDRWDDYDCERVRFGFRKGWWALEAQWDNRGGGHHNNGGGHHNDDNHHGKH